MSAKITTTIRSQNDFLDTLLAQCVIHPDLEDYHFKIHDDKMLISKDGIVTMNVKYVNFLVYREIDGDLHNNAASNALKKIIYDLKT